MQVSYRIYSIVCRVSYRIYSIVCRVSYRIYSIVCRFDTGFIVSMQGFIQDL